MLLLPSAIRLLTSQLHHHRFLHSGVMAIHHTIGVNDKIGDGPQQLVEVLKPHTVLISDVQSATNTSEAGVDPKLRQCTILVGQPGMAAVCEAPSLKWVHLSSAGYTRFDNDEAKEYFKKRGIALTTSSSVYFEPCAQHALAMMLAECRRLHECAASQATGPTWDHFELRKRASVLRRSRVLMLAYGAINRRLAQLLQPFDCDLTIFRTSQRGYELGKVVTSSDELAHAFSKADFVVSSLPANDKTQGLVSRDLLEVMKPTAVFINIGRGTTVDQAALMDVLNQGRIAAAYLDVMEPEPLPKDHPLWRAKNCWITPHTAGGFKGEMAALLDHFIDNLHAFEQGKPMKDRVV